MKNSQTLPNPLWKKLWVTVRFVSFGVLGFVVMIECWVMLAVRLSAGHHPFGETSPFLLVPLLVLGALMMLYGVGEWGRWGYLLVFLSIPLSLQLLFLLMPTSDKGDGVIVPTFAAVGTYLVVRRYYARRNRSKTNPFGVPD